MEIDCILCARKLTHICKRLFACAFVSIIAIELAAFAFLGVVLIYAHDAS